MEKAAAGLNHNHASSAAIRMSVGQPEQGHLALTQVKVASLRA